jgi:hypothetical protein
VGRNILRNPGFVSLDFGPGKYFRMPRSEKQTLLFWWKFFNATNMACLTEAQTVTVDDQRAGSKIRGLHHDPRSAMHHAGCPALYLPEGKPMPTFRPGDGHLPSPFFNPLLPAGPAGERYPERRDFDLHAQKA